MKLILFGATGSTGRCLLEQALAGGHSVVAMVRTPVKLQLEHPNLQVLRGDVLKQQAVEAAITPGADAVLSTLGVRKLFLPTRVLSEGMRNIVAAMQKAGVRRLIVESSYGVGERGVTLGWELAAATVLRGIYQDKEREDDIIRQSGLDWTVVRPPRLTNGARTGHYHAGLDLKLPFSAKIARHDVADFMLRQITDTTYLRKFVVVASLL